MQKPTLSEHKKRGSTLLTPVTSALGDLLKPSSWSTDALPQYLWMALVLDYHGRDEALKKFYPFMKELHRHKLCIAELSKILKLNENDQILFYRIFSEYFSPDSLAPLSEIYDINDSPVFFSHFYNLRFSTEENLKTLDLSMNKYLTFHDDCTCDICFLVLWSYSIAEKLMLSDKVNVLRKALSDYIKHDQKDIEMNLYRSAIRASAAMLGRDDKNFCASFWNRLSSMSVCKQLVIDFPKGDIMNSEYLEDLRVLSDFFQATSNEKMLSSKYNVLLGLTIYSIKLFEDIVEREISDRISGRIVFRTIVETFVNIKYLMIKEEELPDIYEAFMDYGLGKYKLVMSKLREGKYNPCEKSHISHKILEIYANEKNEKII